MTPYVCKLDVKREEYASFVAGGLCDECIRLREQTFVFNMMYIMSECAKVDWQVPR